MKKAHQLVGFGSLAAAAALSPVALLATDTVNSSATTCVAPADSSNAATACALARELERGFVYPDVGERYAEMLRANVAKGAYAELAGEALADRLTDDLQAVQADAHLRVRPASNSEQRQRRAAGERPAMIEQGGWIAPGIAFVRLNGFPGDPAVTAQAAAFMEAHQEAKALIFDIRTNGGGGLDQMDVIFPWLFDAPARLVTMATRRSIDEEMGNMFGSATLYETGSTEQEVVREHWVLPNREGRLQQASVYVLSGPMTGSAGEHFALAMKHTGRATLVGEATYGANHFGGETPLPGGFEVFVPVGRTYDPLTGKDWEGDGVAPDVEMPPEVALEWVLQELGVAAEEASALSETHKPTRPMRRRSG
ncbi:S41 family peptidase [Altererythrobacter sp. MF3-039]|uniref:S41 family peptidase n=1 Tax=Altererythrobacter sp. MF3-039 TaxID=3252901 RepID=UPI00390C72CD